MARSGALKELFARLDDGTTKTRLEELGDVKEDPLAPILFSLKDEYAPQLKELLAYVEEYNQLAGKEGIGPAMVAKSIASWIFHTNRVELLGTQTLGETEKLIAGAMLPLELAQKQAVLQTLNLVQVYNPGSYRAQRPADLLSFDVLRIKGWHTMLWGSVEGRVGVFREDGRYTECTDGSKHSYPHHSVQNWSIQYLCGLVHKALKTIPIRYQGDEVRLALTFALAAFTQFHFVSLHPFEDGNGRISRFLSKRLVDYVLPVPFPMFPDRTAYRQTLEAGGRVAEAVSAPLPLFELMLDSATQHYKKLILDFGTMHPKDILVATSTEELATACERAGLGEDSKAKLVEDFSVIEEFGELKLELEGRQIKLKKFPHLDFDRI